MSAYIAGSAWPDPQDVLQVEWTLRYAPDEMTRSQQLVAASFIAAYKSLVAKTERSRRDAIRTIRVGGSDTPADQPDEGELLCFHGKPMTSDCRECQADHEALTRPADQPGKDVQR